MNHDGHNVLDKLHWGLGPFWAKEAKTGYKWIGTKGHMVGGDPFALAGLWEICQDNVESGNVQQNY